MFGWFSEARTSLRAEIGRAGRVSRDGLRQHLDGHGALQVRVRRAVDLAHATGAEGGNHLIGAETGAGVRAKTAADYTGGGRAEAISPPDAAGRSYRAELDSLARGDQSVPMPGAVRPLRSAAAQASCGWARQTAGVLLYRQSAMR